MSLDAKMRKSLSDAGFRVGDVADFLGLSDEEMRLVELRVALSRAVRRRRQARKMTQQQLATRLKSSQSRVAKIEAGSSDVSLDLMFRSLFAVGGGMADVASVRRPARRKARAS
jgi:ribosome-binding protein aMBF1 (putative translation factor)